MLKRKQKKKKKYGSFFYYVIFIGLQKIMEYWTGIGVSGFNIAGVQYLTENSTFIDDDGVSFCFSLDFIYIYRERMKPEMC